ncbi:MAG TPA: hypothetical protein EYH03_01220 [Chromatiales bacterium]|nr:hypothetical protein [Chromatiales bacterium]
MDTAARKPDTRTVMRKLIKEVRSIFPFDAPEAEICSDGCSLKLLEFVAQQLDEWELRLDAGELPNFGDLHRFGRLCQKTFDVLQRNGLVGASI